MQQRFITETEDNEKEESRQEIKVVRAYFPCASMSVNVTHKLCVHCTKYSVLVTEWIFCQQPLWDRPVVQTTQAIHSITFEAPLATSATETAHIAKYAHRQMER